MRNLLKITEAGALLLSSTSIEQNQNTFYNVHNSQHSCVVQVLFMCGFDKHLLAARLVPLPRHGNFTKKITYTSDFFIIIRYLLSTQSMISRLYLGKYKANAKKYTYLLKKGKQNKVKNHLLPISPQSDQTVTSEVPIKNI